MQRRAVILKVWLAFPLYQRFEAKLFPVPALPNEPETRGPADRGGPFTSTQARLAEWGYQPAGRCRPGDRSKGLFLKRAVL